MPHDEEARAILRQIIRAYHCRVLLAFLGGAALGVLGSLLAHRFLF